MKKSKGGPATSQLTQPLKWHCCGGKHYLAKWIIGHMPDHTHYVEPYFGGGSVLLQKDYQGVSEVVNDLNSELTCFWSAMTNPEVFEQFKRHVEGMPLSEQVFEEAGYYLQQTELRDAVATAVAFFVRARQSRQGLMKDFATMSRNRTRRGMNEQVSSWLTAIEGLPDIHARMKRVAVMNRPAIDLIRQQDGPNTLFYLDPPYAHETRVTTSDYKCEMSANDHAELLTWLAGIKGKFLLSGYPSELYEHHRKAHGWHVVSREIDNKASAKKVKDKKIECLWANYPLVAGGNWTIKEDVIDPQKERTADRLAVEYGLKEGDA